MTNIAPCPNPWCSSHRRDALGSKPFIFPNDSDGGPVRVSCPVCPMEGPMEDSVAEAIEAWNHRVSPSQVAPANPAQVTELHGPFGWLNGHRALSEDSWTLESDPLENSEEYFAIPLYALTDPFKEIGKDFDGTLTAAIGAGGQAVALPEKPTQAMRIAYDELNNSHGLDRFVNFDLVWEKILSHLPSCSGSGGQAVAVKPLDLSTLLRDAFLSGRGLKDGDKLSDEDQAAWMKYDPERMNAYHRISSALSQPHPADDRVVEALRPFAAIADEYADDEDDDFQVWRDFDVLGATLPLRHFRKARSALAALSPTEGR